MGANSHYDILFFTGGKSKYNHLLRQIAISGNGGPLERDTEEEKGTESS